MAQKDESLRKYQDMLREAREDLTKQARQHDEEVILLNEQLQNKRDFDFIRFKEFVAQGGNPAMFAGTPSTSEVRFLSARLAELSVSISVGASSRIGRKCQRSRTNDRPSEREITRSAARGRTMENAFDAESRTIPTRTRKVRRSRRFSSLISILFVQ